MRAFQRVQMGIAMVPEGRRLFTGLTVEENLKVAGASRREGAWDMERVLTSFPLLRGCLKRRGGDLSGGQQQATAIGRALMTNPRVLLHGGPSTEGSSSNPKPDSATTSQNPATQTSSSAEYQEGNAL
jgi:ABC-type branched-subunit amino acid transport system ATPase component